MKILKKFLKFSFIYVLIYPNKVALTDNSQKEIIKWKRIDNSSYEIKELIWEKIDDFNFQKEIDKINFTDNTRKINDKFELGLIQLSNNFPTAHTLQEGLWNIYGDQVFPISEGESGGSANQNYSIFFNSGVKKNMMLSTFFAITDDPLHKKVSIRNTQPSNLWLNLGGSVKYKIFDGEKVDFSLNTALEYWKVKSGGCNSGFGSIGGSCESQSSNIFNNNIEPVVNDNIIGSLAISFN